METNNPPISTMVFPPTIEMSSSTNDGILVVVALFIVLILCLTGVLQQQQKSPFKFGQAKNVKIIPKNREVPFSAAGGTITITIHFDELIR